MAASVTALNQLLEGKTGVVREASKIFGIPPADFRGAASSVLAFLYARLGFDIWMVIRTKGDDWIVVQAEDHGYGLKEATVLPWSDSLCSQMVLGRGPRIAPRCAAVPAYLSAPFARRLHVGAYIGVPLTRGDGTLFGTLCGFHPVPQPDVITADLPLVEMLAALLSSLLEADFHAKELNSQVEREHLETLSDSLTGLYNRRGWDQLLAAEDKRCLRYGHPACVVAVDLDTLKLTNDKEGHSSGDELLRRAAIALRGSARQQDIVARVGGDEFAVLGVECDRAGADGLVERLREALLEAQVDASCGVGMRRPPLSLEKAWRDADAAMYAQKRLKKGMLAVAARETPVARIVESPEDVLVGTA